MMKTFRIAAFSIALGIAAAANAQNPTPAPLQIPNPHYVSIQFEIIINKPAAEVWKRVGNFCPDWLAAGSCSITSGKDGELGAVRSLGGGEVLVAKTELSYTYTQPVRVGVPYNLYHSTVEARAVTPTTTRVSYTLVFDNSMLPDEAARNADIDRRRTMFTGILQTMKTAVEGGTAPPPATAPAR